MYNSMIVTDDKGRRFKVSIDITELKEDCGEDVDELTDLSADSNVEDSISFEALVQEYMLNYAENKLKPSTIDTYKTAIERYLMGSFGHMNIRAISGRYISSYMNTAAFPETGKPLTKAKLKMLYYCLRSIMKYALRQHYIDRDPSNDVIMPERRDERDNRKKYLENREIHSFLKLFEAPTQYNTAIKLLLFTGLRCGELLGLKWGDIDFKRHVINVDRNLAFVRGGYIFTSPKSEAGRRSIYMSKSVEGLLKEHKQRRNADKRQAKEDMVFTNKSGGMLSRQTLNRELHKATGSTPFRSMSLHCLRHCNATMLINNGVNIKIVAEHLGHSKISTTADIYANVTDESRRKVAAVLEKKLQKSM